MMIKQKAHKKNTRRRWEECVADMKPNDVLRHQIAPFDFVCHYNIQYAICVIKGVRYPKQRLGKCEKQGINPPNFDRLYLPLYRLQVESHAVSRSRSNTTLNDRFFFGIGQLELKFTNQRSNQTCKFCCCEFLAYAASRPV